MANITPIKAHIHWDDIEAVWTAKVSRAAKETGGNIPWQDEIFKALTLTELILDILAYWAASGSTIMAPIGDLTAMAAAALSLVGTFTLGDLTVVAGEPEYPGFSFTETPHYGGVEDDWGTTPP